MKTPDLKPCQKEALKNFEHDDSYFIKLRVKCPVHEHYAGTSLHREYLNGAAYAMAKNELIYKLCEGCTEVENSAEETIQQLQYENAQLNRCIENLTYMLNAAHTETAKLQAERDAAVSELIGTCQVCKWEDTEKCANCHFNPEAWNVYESNWEWRGVQKEE